MAGLNDYTTLNRHFQDYANLVLGVLLFLSPWALGYANTEMAARTAWIGGIVIAILALAAIVNFAEWEEWLTLLMGAAVLVSPYLLGFSDVRNAVAAHNVIGLLVVLASGWELWTVHHRHTPSMR
ncbi:SPW repeat protein [Rhodoblastus sp.]|uniref:SPW repeat protein n=1 Tax=Rhodoblastus sp. TaxID=1962975 RepID=UPI003F9577AD